MIPTATSPKKLSEREKIAQVEAGTSKSEVERTQVQMLLDTDLSLDIGCIRCSRDHILVTINWQTDTYAIDAVTIVQRCFRTLQSNLLCD